MCGFSLDDTEKYTTKQSEGISNFLIKFKKIYIVYYFCNLLFYII